MSRIRTTELPGIIVGLFFLSLMILIWPVVLENFVSLDWRIGDMRPVVHGLEVILACLTLAMFLARRQVSSVYFKIFPTQKKLVFAIVAVSLSLVVTVIGSEMLCRSLGLPFDNKQKWTPDENALARFDTELGWSYIPNHSVVQDFGAAHRKVAMYFDDIGSRVLAPGVRHDPAAPTVLFVGDSYTFGHGLPYEEAFEGLLESMPDFPYQVVNLGVQGYGTDQALLLLKKYIKRFNTKAVVYTYIDEAIVRNANYDRRILYRYLRILGTKPLFALRRDGTVYLEKKPIRYEDYHYSRLWACFQVVWSRWGPKRGVRLTRALVEEMRDYTECNGANFILINWYERDYHRWNPPPSLPPGETPFRGLNLNGIDTAVHPPPGWSTWLIPGDEHPDARAHAYVAGLVAQELKQLLGK